MGAVWTDGMIEVLKETHSFCTKCKGQSKPDWKIASDILWNRWKIEVTAGACSRKWNRLQNPGRDKEYRRRVKEAKFGQELPLVLKNEEAPEAPTHVEEQAIRREKESLPLPIYPKGLFINKVNRTWGYITPEGEKKVFRFDDVEYFRYKKRAGYIPDQKTVIKPIGGNAWGVEAILQGGVHEVIWFGDSDWAVRVRDTLDYYRRKYSVALGAGAFTFIEEEDID